MELPHTIASLPKPLDPVQGKIRCAAVHSVTAGRKRKRHEVVAAVDGETVNIYNVQSQSIAASYPLPPQTFLCCPPCSTYHKATKQAKARRSTLLVVRDSPHDAKRRLLSLEDEIFKQKGEGSLAIGPARKDIKLPVGEILAVEAVEETSIGTSYRSETLVYYEDGRIVRCDGDTVHEIRYKTGDEFEIHVEFAVTLDLLAVRQSLLAGRDDLLAELDTLTLGTSLRHIVCRIIQSNNKRFLQMLALSLRSHGILGQGTEELHLVTSFELPSSERSLQHKCAYELHASSGTLYQISNGKLTIFDLTGSTAHVKLRKGDPVGATESTLHLTQSTFLAVGSNKAAVFETTFGSLVASTSLSAESVNESGKRQRAEGVAEPSSFRPVAFCKDLGLIVGCVGTSLVGIQLSDSLPRTKRAKLSDVLSARSIHQPNDGAVRQLAQDTTLQKIERWSAQLRDAVTAQDSYAVESLVHSTLYRGGTKKRAGAIHDVPTTNENGAITNLVLSSDFDLVHLDQRKVRDLLRALFKVQEGPSSARPRLVLAMPSASVYRDLASAGLLTLNKVQSAIGSEFPIQPGDIMRAVVACDGTFRVMYELISIPIQWELPELVQGLNLLIQSFETSPEGEESTSTADFGTMANNDALMINGDADSHLERQSLLAERELNLAMSALQNGLQLRSELFRTILDRLATFPQTLLTKCMRDTIRPTELVFFMRILRIEVISGGWLDRCIRDDDEQTEASIPAAPASILDSDHSPADAAIRQIGLLLNCAIDATGLNGWLVGESADTLGTTALIHEMRSEISAVMEGLYELKALTVLTEEMERYGSVYEQARLSGNNFNGGLAKGKTDRDRALPLDLTSAVPARPVQTTSTGKKSSRALAAEERAKIGQYTFERIRI